MKRSLLLRVLTNFSLLFLFVYPSLAQFETTIGRVPGSDETSDIKSLPNGNTAVLATTTSFGPDKILLIELNPAGTVVSFKIIFGTDILEKFIGTNLALDLDASGNHVGYFITGCKGNYPTQMILIHTDKFGDPDWSAEMDNNLDPNSTPLSECGISLERQSNGDIIVVGRTNAGGGFHSRFSLSRFSPLGVLIWSNRYSSPHNQYIPNESCNGLRGSVEVVTVVGHVHNEVGIGHTYLSCIKASTGTEIWRNQYNSRHEHDDGTDLVQNPVDQRYMVVGHAENYSPGLAGPTRMWVFNVTGNTGAFTDGATYFISSKNNLFARDVCLSTDKIAGAITGFLDYTPVTGAPSETKTFIIKLPFTPAALPLFSHYFTDSDPLNFLFADDAIDLTQSANPGYVLGTQAKLAGAGLLDYDVHALRLDQFGKHNDLITCPVVQIAPRPEREGTSFNLQKKRTAVKWSTLEVASRLQNYNEEPCIDPASPENISSKSFHFTDSKLFPNPAFAGSDLNIHLEMEYNSPIEIQLLDMTGKLYSQLREVRSKGSHLVSFALPATLAPNIYVVKLNLQDGRSQVLKVMIH